MAAVSPEKVWGGVATDVTRRSAGAGVTSVEAERVLLSVYGPSQVEGELLVSTMTYRPAAARPGPDRAAGVGDGPLDGGRLAGEGLGRRRHGRDAQVGRGR